MSHYLAELLEKAENGSAKQKKIASREAVDTILKVWEHRVVLPGNAYPLSHFKDIIKVLDVLRPEASQWDRNSLSGFDKLAADIYEDYRLIIILLLGANLELLGIERKSRSPIGPVSEDELRLVEAMNIFSDVHFPKSTEPYDNDILEEAKNTSVVDSLYPLIDILSEKLRDLKEALAQHNQDDSEPE